MPTLAPGAKTSLSHSLVVGTPGFPARMRIQLEFSCFSAYNERNNNMKTSSVKWIKNYVSVFWKRNLEKIATISPESGFIVGNNSGSITASKGRNVFSSSVRLSDELALMSVLRRDDVSVNGDIGFGEETAEGGEFGVGVGIWGTIFTELGRWFRWDGIGSGAIADGEERRFVMFIGFEFVEEDWIEIEIEIESGEGGVDWEGEFRYSCRWWWWWQRPHIHS